MEVNQHNIIKGQAKKEQLKRISPGTSYVSNVLTK